MLFTERDSFKNTIFCYLPGESERERERERVVDERTLDAPSYNHFNM